MNIEIKTNNTLTYLVGNTYGQDVYNEQVKNKINLSEVNSLIFSENITSVAISFVQGFTRDLMNELGEKKFKQIINIIGNKKFTDKFEKCLN